MLMLENLLYLDRFCIIFKVVFRNLTGNIDKRVLEKYAKEAKELNRESWYFSWAMDTSQEERAKVFDLYL